MIADLLESLIVANLARPKLPWMLVASSLLLLGLLLYVMLVNYLPAKQRITSLERELKEVYAREVSLTSLRAEREALARRIEELERELAAARPRDSGRR